MFCCTLLYVHSSIAIILMGKRELIALLNLSSWCLVMVERLFLAVPRGCLQFVIVVFPDHTHLLFLVSVSVLIGCICETALCINLRASAVSHTHRNRMKTVTATKLHRFVFGRPLTYKCMNRIRGRNLRKCMFTLAQ